MPPANPPGIVVAGAGIAGLTAALAFARRGFAVQLFERSPDLREIGAGLQLSPNATRVLDRLGVLPHLMPLAVRPPAIVLRDAKTLRRIASVPLGDFAERRWGAPYLVVHRADLQGALLAAAAGDEKIAIATGAEVTGFAPLPDGSVSVVTRSANSENRQDAKMLIGADGVWSALRKRVSAAASSRFLKLVAWRRTLPADNPLIQSLLTDFTVNAFLHPGFHLVAYPVKAGAAFNLVAFTPGQGLGEDWAAKPSPAPLVAALRRTAAPLAALADEADAWTAWPIHTVEGHSFPWIRDGNLVLIGDAAHAMTPFAAQGAAMAIEDAWTLAGAFSKSSNGLDAASTYSAETSAAQNAALDGWEKSRRERIEKVVRRGAFNHFVWHAAGPIAWGRDLVLRLRPPEKLAADLDWLYGWDVGEA